MEILADANVPEEYVSALQGEGHTVVYSRDIDSLGPEATDDEIATFAETSGLGILSTDSRLILPVPNHSGCQQSSACSFLRTFQQ
jgi:predicted nuclease of predicted toxin-antitoxin system